MGIKVTANIKEVEQENKYPYIGIGREGTVVLFSDKDTGTVLVKTNYYDVGFYLKEWSEEYFTPCIGSITLENT